MGPRRDDQLQGHEVKTQIWEDRFCMRDGVMIGIAPAAMKIPNNDLCEHDNEFGVAFQTM